MVLNNINIHEDVIKYIVTLLRDKFSIDIDSNTKRGENFFGSNIGISAKDMIYLLYLSEQRYNICFEENEIGSLSFFTLDGLSDSIVKHMKNMVR